MLIWLLPTKIGMLIVILPNLEIIFPVSTSEVLGFLFCPELLLIYIRNICWRLSVNTMMSSYLLCQNCMLIEIMFISVDM